MFDLRPIRTTLLAVIALIVGVAVTPSNPASAQETPPIAWAVNGFGTTAAETAAATTTFELLVNGFGEPEPLTVAPGERVAIPDLVDGNSYDISFRNTSSGATTSSVRIRPTTTDTVEVAVHPTASGSTTTTAFVNDEAVPAGGAALTVRHTAATGPTEFQLFRGGGESGAPLSPVGEPVTLTNATEAAFGTALAPTTSYMIEARLPSGSTARTSFTGGGGEVGGNRVVYLTGLNDIDGTTAGGESGPFITPTLATTGGEGGRAGLYVINGFSPGATESANSFTVELNGIAVGSEGGLRVAPGERIAVPQATRGGTFEVSFENGGTSYSAGTIDIPGQGSIDAAIYPDTAGSPVATTFDNTAVAAPSSGAAVVMRNISTQATVDMSIYRGGNETPNSGTLVGSPASVPNGAQETYGSELAAGAILYFPQADVAGTDHRSNAFIVGGENTNSEVRAVYAIGSELPPAGEFSPVRSFQVADGRESQPLSIVNGFGIGSTETANSFRVRINGVTLSSEITVAPRSRVKVPVELDRGTTVSIELVDPTTSAVRASAMVEIPAEGTVDLVVAPDADGDPGTSTHLNGFAPASSAELVARHAAGIGTVDVSLYEGGGESGAPLTRVAGPISLAPNAETALASGLTGSATYQLEVELPDGSILTTPYTPEVEAGGVLQAAYLVGLGAGGIQTNASLRSFIVPAGSGSSSVVTRAPVRLVETRPGFTTIDGIAQGGGAIIGGTTRTFAITGRADIPRTAEAIVANFTVVNGQEPGFITPYPCDERPNSSLVNWSDPTAIANATIMPLSDNGTICVYASATVDVIIDVSGHLPAVSDITTISPTRLVETRPGFTTIDGIAQGGGAIIGGTTRTFAITGRADIPRTAEAIVANFTVVNGQEPGFITPYPCDERPNSSLVNWSDPTAIANATIMPLSDNGTICVYASATVDVIIDVSGHLPAGSDITTISPTRLVETRPGFTTIDGIAQGGGAIIGGTTRTFAITGRADIPRTAEAIVANFTVVNGQEPGFITPYPCDERPNSSLVNWSDPTAIANATIMPLSDNGTICVYASATVDVIIDVSGHL